jgi:diacylglycerol kinase family enzyme
VKITSREIFRYRAKNYTLKINGGELKRKAFLITVANAGQYGNDFYIAPKADMRDGKFHVSILRSFSFYHVPGLLRKIMTRKADESRHIETYVADTLEIIREDEGPIHYDGEPAMEPKAVSYKCAPSALKVIVGEKFPKS